MYISELCTLHGGLCKPSSQNLVDVRSSSGTYLRSLPHNTLCSLFRVVDSGERLNVKNVTNALRPVWPKKKTTTKHTVYNVNRKVKHLLPTYRQVNSYRSFIKSMTERDQNEGIGNNKLLDDKVAYKIAHETCQSILHNEGVNEESIFSILEFSELLSYRAKGFSYEKLVNTTEGKKQLFGVLWMTATTRRNYELFGDYICFDMMKRGLNIFLWPYSGIALLDETNCLFVCLEGFVCGE